MRRDKGIEWHEIRHRIYTLRRMNWRLWQLIDQERRIIAEGSRQECRQAMDRLRAPACWQWLAVRETPGCGVRGQRAEGAVTYSEIQVRTMTA